MEEIGKYYNMTYAVFENEHYYICHDGRELHHIRTERKEQDGYTQTVEVYGLSLIHIFLIALLAYIDRRNKRK